MQTESPIGPGYYPNLPTAFDTVLKKPASKVFGETRHTLHALLFRVLGFVITILVVMTTRSEGVNESRT